MKKIVSILIIALIVISAVAILLSSNKNSNELSEQVMLEQTFAVSTEYLSLSYQTENILENAESFGDYDSWNSKMDEIIKDWQDLQVKANELEKIADGFANEKVGMKIIPYAHALSKEEINNIFDKAPAGKKIRTLANHLGVDAQRAQLILNQTQNEVTREAYGEEGDVFEQCEQNSMRIKNGAKVVGFVGGVVLTGGASAVVASGALATTATVVVGADLVLEITEDEARIALGDKNKVSEMVSGVRSVTEPAAAILTITNIPGNLSKGIDKLSAISFGADQLRSSVQDEKVLGISIKSDETGGIKAEIARLTEEELPIWREENQAVKSNESIQEIINNAKLIAEEKAIEKENEIKQNNETQQGEEKKDEISKTPNNEIKLMPVKEFEKLFYDFKIEKISDVKEIFGEPDIVNTLDDGYGNYIYHKRLVYPNGNIAGMMIRFQNLDVGGYSIMMEEYK